MKKIYKQLVLYFAVLIFIFSFFCSCAPSGEEKEVEIISARYLLITYEESYDEILDVSFYYNGYQQYDIDPDFDLVIGNENKVILYCYSQTGGYAVREVVLTAETYNNIINTSPNIYEF